MTIPKVVKIRQRFRDDRIADVVGAVVEGLEGSGIELEKGTKIAVAVGSRGIANLQTVVRTVNDWVRRCGADPFVIPAMGSHGGATAEGQREVLESYGISGKTVNAPVVSSMEVVELSDRNLENRVYMDRMAHEAGGVILINRIKPHTDFHGPIESGLVKMSVIGLGNHRQAAEIHHHGIRGLKELIVPTAREVLKTGKILLGVALVENAYDETALVRVLRPENFLEEERKLLKLAKENMPSLPVDGLDVLVIDRFGKDISGAGLDTNIIGRLYIRGEKEPERPNITRIVLLDLTASSHGNALGLGLADIVTQRVIDEMDPGATYANTLTSTFLDRGKIPIVAEHDKQAVEYALSTCGPVKSAGIIRIQDTLHLSEIYVSENFLEELSGNSIEIIGEPRDLFRENRVFGDF